MRKADVIKVVTVKNGLMDLTGKRFGRLVVISINTNHELKTQQAVWSVRCDCGNELDQVPGQRLRQGHTTSCGCFRKEASAQRATTNGWSKQARPFSPESLAWLGAMQRCSNPDNIGYKNYGGRGIAVCNRWSGEHGCESFLTDMGKRPSAKHSIDRIENGKGYWCGKAECPECGPLGRSPNCRWATKKQQANNTRRNVLVTFSGETKTIAGWSEATGINPFALRSRVNRGWSIEKALSTRHDARRKSTNK